MKTNQRKTMRYKVLSATIALAALGGAAVNPAQADDTVIIGLAGPLTGPSARIGKDLENGAQLAIDL